MKGHLGAVITSGLVSLALAFALLQVVVLAHSAPRYVARSAEARGGPSNRYSIPGGRSGIPWTPFDKSQPQPAPPANREGRTPQRLQEEHRTPPPPSRYRLGPPRLGPQPARKVTA